MPFLNPFKRHDREEFLGVVVPLAPSSPPENRQSPSRVEESPEKDDKKLDRVASEENGVSSNPEYSHQTLEAIRAEVDNEIAASGHDTVYDRM